MDTATQILGTMKAIVIKDRLAHAVYATLPMDEEYEHAICEGRRFCAIGSLYWAAGIRPSEEQEAEARNMRTQHPFLPGVSRNAVLLPGVMSNTRDEFLDERPELRKAYDALNEAAQRWADNHGVDLDNYEDFDVNQFWHSKLERLFEGYGEPVGSAEMVEIIDDAMARV